MQFSNTVLLAAVASLSNAHQVNERSFEGPVLEARSNWQVGDCYSSSGSLFHHGTDIYQSSGACETAAGGNNVVIALTNGNDCYYGNQLPPASDKVDSSKCNVNCVGYPSDNCGADGFFRIYTNGVVTATSDGSSSDSDSSSGDSSSPATTTAPPSSQISVITASGAEKTVVVTQANANQAAAATVSLAATTSPASGSNSNNSGHTAAIVAGVVVGIVGAAAIAGAIFFWLRSRKHKEEAAELQRQNSIAGLRSEKPPSTYSLTDSRLEPAYMRRMSDGSIADNQDYSRRILKVTN